MGIDLKQVRRDTPGCKNVIHLNNAGASLSPRPVLDAYIGHIELEAANGGYEAGEASLALQQAFYKNAARLIGARAEEIAYFDSATRAWTTACHALVLGLEIGTGDKVLVAASEYINNFITLNHLAQRHGFEIEQIPCGANGEADINALGAMLDERVKLIALTHAPANSGIVHPAEEIGQLARAAGVAYLVDAAQTAGQWPLDVNAIGCDALVAPGRKYLRGPRGTAFLYASDRAYERLLPPVLNSQGASVGAGGVISMNPDASRFEIWEGNIAAKIALGVAIGYALDREIPAIQERNNALASGLREKLAAIKGVRVVDEGANKSGIVCVLLEDHDPIAVRALLAQQKINTSVIQPQMTILDSARRSLPALLRSSVHYYNNTEELDKYCSALEAALS